MRNFHIILAVVLVTAVVTTFRVALIALGSIIYLYLLPAVIAGKRDHLKTRQLYWVCGLSGWLIVPWIAALIYVHKLSDPVLANDIPLLASASED